MSLMKIPRTKPSNIGDKSPDYKAEPYPPASEECRSSQLVHTSADNPKSSSEVKLLLENPCFNDEPEDAEDIRAKDEVIIEVISYVVAQDILGAILCPNMMVEQHIRVCIRVRITKHSFFKSHGLSTKVFLACEEDS